MIATRSEERVEREKQPAPETREEAGGARANMGDADANSLAYKHKTN